MVIVVLLKKACKVDVVFGLSCIEDGWLKWKDWQFLRPSSVEVSTGEPREIKFHGALPCREWHHNLPPTASTTLFSVHRRGQVPLKQRLLPLICGESEHHL